MSIQVNTPGGIANVANGVDFVVDWPEHAGDGGPGLEILDKPEDDNTARIIAYYPPGQWLGVLNQTPPSPTGTS